MANKKSITVEGSQISLLSKRGEDEYFSLTDIAKKFDDRPDLVIQNWLRNRNTVEFLGVWEKLNNPDFKPLEFEGIRNQTGLNTFSLSTKKWINKTNAIGLQAKAGRYGGTYPAPLGTKQNQWPGLCWGS